VQLGKPEKAMEWARRALEIDPEEPMTYYNVACVYGLLKKVEEAIDCLENAVKYGYRHRAWVEHDSDLNACRNHPRFQALLARL
jgi:adenylate cyclase